MNEKHFDKMAGEIERQKQNLREAKFDLKNSVLSDNWRTQADVSVVVSGRRYSLTTMSRNTGYSCLPRPGYEMMLLAAKKILARYIQEQEELIDKLQTEFVEEAKRYARGEDLEETA